MCPDWQGVFGPQASRRWPFGYSNPAPAEPFLAAPGTVDPEAARQKETPSVIADGANSFSVLFRTQVFFQDLNIQFASPLWFGNPQYNAGNI